MPCCKAKRLAQTPVDHSAWTANKTICGCEIRPAANDPYLPSNTVKAQPSAVAVAPTFPALLTTWGHVAEPGILGSDSGPPLDAAHAPDLGRAPPVA